MNEPLDQTALAMAGITEAMRQQTASFIRAMEAQTNELKRLGEKVEAMQTRVIRLEEQRHGKDIDRLTAVFEASEKRIALLELNWAQARGAGALMNWLRTFMPWVAGIALAFLLATGVEFDPVKGGRP